MSLINNAIRKEITHNWLAAHDCNSLVQKSLTNEAPHKEIPYIDLFAHNCNSISEKSFKNEASYKQIPDDELSVHDSIYHVVKLHVCGIILSRVKDV